MEIKAELLKPYTEDERMNFIIEQNHRKGYKIETQEDKIVALGYTKEEQEQLNKEQLIEEYKQQLNELDLKSIRAIRSNDVEYIAKYEAEAEEIRNKIKELNN